MITVNADDFGLSPEVNAAVRECFNKGTIQRTTIMMNAPYANDAIEMAKAEGFADRVGLHLNLTSGKPLSRLCINTLLCGNDGNFCNLFYCVNRGSRYYLSKKLREAVAAECRAQIKSYTDAGLKLAHLDGHHHVHTNPSVFRILLPILKEFNFRTIRVARTFPSISESKLKKNYKRFINNTIERFNGHSYQYFMQVADLDMDTSWYTRETLLEVECHPVYKGGILTDSGNQPFEKVIEKVNKIDESTTH